ncbi:hypothetical protein V2J09_006509 [Rumex salicifolius]
MLNLDYLVSNLFNSIHVVARLLQEKITTYLGMLILNQMMVRRLRVFLRLKAFRSLHKEAEVSVLRSLLCNRQEKVTIHLVHEIGYKIVKLEERHTHELVAEKDRQFMCSRRKLNFEHKKFIMDCEKASIGPVRSHRLFNEIVGGYSQVGAYAVVFKNYWNYFLFGDIISFDATYRTNRTGHPETQEGKVELRIINNAPRSDHPMEYEETCFGVNDTIVSQCIAIEEREAVMNQLVSDFYSCVNLLEDKPDMMKAFSVYMMQKKESLLFECGNSATSSISIHQNLEKYCGVEVPSKQQQSTAGSASAEVQKSRNSSSISKLDLCVLYFVSNVLLPCLYLSASYCEPVLERYACCR